jgi:hypothetical protein
MKVNYVVAAALIAAACGSPAAQEPPTATEVALQKGEQKTSSDPAVNPNAAVMAEFKMRVEKYAELHKDLARGEARQKDGSDPARINAAKAALAEKLMKARAGARQGDIFFPEARPVFRRLLAPELKGEEGRDAKAILKDDAPAPGTVPFKVNAKYPENQPLPTVPAPFLLALPQLPEPLEYRIVGQHLLLLDTAAGVIVDYLLNAIAT